MKTNIIVLNVKFSSFSRFTDISVVLYLRGYSNRYFAKISDIKKFDLKRGEKDKKKKEKT